MILATGSCADENLIAPDGNQSQHGNPYSAYVKVNLIACESALRTRDVTMDPGAVMNITSLWVGIYDIKTGHRLGMKENRNLNRTLIQAGKEVLNAMQVEVQIEDDTKSNDVVMVGVANYHNVETDNYGNGRPLADVLNEALTWEDFSNITFGTWSARAAIEKTDEPLLMGYYYIEDDLDQTKKYVTKINQIPSSEEGEMPGLAGNDNNAIKVFPAENLDKIKMTLSKDNVYEEIDVDAPEVELPDEDNDYSTRAGETKTFYSFKTGTLQLRRLRSQINVNIITGDGVTVNDVHYKRFNLPMQTFLAARRTDPRPQTRDFDGWQKYSANASDLRIEQKGGLYNIDNAYYSDAHWQPTNDNLQFSFQHFENKRWGIGTVSGASNTEKYASREKVKAVNSFTETTSPYQDPSEGGNEPSTRALPEGKEALYPALTSEEMAYHNYGSGFVLKMNVFDTKNGRYGQVEYTIHDGFCNDVEGNELLAGDPNYNDRFLDFACVRNTVYNFTIRVNGIDNILVNATSGETLRDDQSGEVWSIIYPEKMENGSVPIKGAEYEPYFSFTEEEIPNIAFRVIGDDDDGNRVDYYYNCHLNSDNPWTYYNNFYNVGWPRLDSSTEFIDYNDPANITPDSPQNNEEAYGKIKTLLNNLYITDSKGAPYTVDEWIAKVKPNEKYGFKIGEYDYQGNLNEIKEHFRALYIFNTNEIVYGVSDGIQNTAHRIYGVIQYPVDTRPVVERIAPVFPDNRYVISTESNCWRGSQYGYIPIQWTHKDGIIGYTLRVDNNVVEIPRNDIPKYLSNGVFTYNYITDDLAIGSHNVTITPTIDTERFQTGEGSLACSGIMKVGPCGWLFSESGTTNKWDPKGYYNGDSTHLDWTNFYLSDSQIQKMLSTGGNVEFLGLEYHSPVITSSGSFCSFATESSADATTDLKDYFLSGGGGSLTGRHFKIRVSGSGYLLILVKNNKGNNDTPQYMYIYDENQNLIATTGAVTNSIGKKYVDKTSELADGQIHDLYIYSDLSWRTYLIAWIPKRLYNPNHS